MPQKGISYYHDEIAQFIIQDAAKISHEQPEDLKVSLMLINDRVSAVVTHRIFKKDIQIKEFKKT